MIDRYGFRSLKLKGGVFPPEDEIAAIEALRVAFPDHPLRLDPNCAWTFETSLRVAERTDGLLQYLEDPTPGLAGMADVAAKAPMPLATNMCVVDFGDPPEAVARSSVQVVLADHHYWGGLTESARLAAICRTFGLGLSMHSTSHLGVSLAAMVHLGAATPNLTYAADTHTLAATYHCTRAATPLHPRRQVVDARYAALYRPVRDVAWAGQRLRPAAPDWLADPDPFGTAAAQLYDAGLRVNAWIVLAHNTRPGTAHPDVAVVNCFGEVYPYALCPGHPEVRRHAATLAAEALRDTAADAVSLEACGQLGVVHLGHHEKTDGAWTPYAQRLLSVCCCTACRAAWRGAGENDELVVAALRADVRAEASGVSRKLNGGLADLVLRVRHQHTDELRAQVLAAVHQFAPGAPVTLHANPDPWATGPSPGLTPTGAGEVDALLVPAWPTEPATADVVAAATGSGLPVDAYVTVLSNADGHTLTGHARRLLAAGASRLSLYHLGLAPSWRQRAFRDILAAVAGH
jgi:Enolase C-terminal domain-like